MGKRIAYPAGLAVLAAALVLWTGCKSNTPSAPTGTTQHVFTSSLDSGHSHTVTMNMSDVTSPPTSGLSMPTSLNQGHTHTLVMTMAHLMSVQGGGSVSVTTSLDLGHSHVFTISRWF